MWLCVDMYVYFLPLECKLPEAEISLSLSPSGSCSVLCTLNSMSTTRSREVSYSKQFYRSLPDLIGFISNFSDAPSPCHSAWLLSAEASIWISQFRMMLVMGEGSSFEGVIGKHFPWSMTELARSFLSWLLQNRNHMCIYFETYSNQWEISFYFCEGWGC